MNLFSTLSGRPAISTIASIIVLVIGLIHIYIWIFEMFRWETRGPKVFSGFTAEFFKDTKALAANQGLYNAFLGVALVLTYFISDELWQQRIALYLSGCVLVAGIYGAITVEKKILFMQAVPAAIAIGAILFT